MASMTTLLDRIRLAEVQAMSSFQLHLSPLEPMFIFSSNLGDPQNGYLLYFVFAFVFISHSSAFKILWTSLLAEWINLILKWTFNDHRPYWWSPMAAKYLMSHNDTNFFGDITTDYDYTRQLSRLRLKQFAITCETGPGFPSGHVMCSAAVWFSLIIQLIKYKVITSRRHRLAMRIAFISLLMAVSLGRVYISAHFPDQCLAGLLVGVVFAVCVEKLVDIQRLRLMGHMVMSLTLLAIAYAFHDYMNRFGGQSGGAEWSLELAKQYCIDINWVKADSSPLYVVWRTAGAAAGTGVAFTLLLPILNKYLSIGRNKHNFMVHVVNVMVSTAAVVIYANYSRPEPTFLATEIGYFYVKSFIQFMFIPIVGLLAVVVNDKIMRLYFQRVLKC